MVKNVIMLTDPVLNIFGSVRPAILIGKFLVERGFKVCLVSQIISSKIKIPYVNVISLGRENILPKTLAIVEAWVRRIKNKATPCNNCVLINLSQGFEVQSHIYYGQGPLYEAMEDIVSKYSVSNPYKLLYLISKKVVAMLDKNFNKSLREKVEVFIANSYYTKKLYEKIGIEVDKVIYPPIDANVFKPSTKTPLENYVLTYFGKETWFKPILKLLDLGVKIVAFGSKPLSIPRKVLRHRNLVFLGYVPTLKLVKLYSNALYTLFTFTHEPFGYIPVESMACGTPVLTYDRQGPRETVIPEETGWLVRDDNELVKCAIRIWREKYNYSIRRKCKLRSLKFHYENVGNEWLKIIMSI